MKRLFSVILIIMMIFALMACKPDPVPPADQEIVDGENDLLPDEGEDDVTSDDKNDDQLPGEKEEDVTPGDKDDDSNLPGDDEDDTTTNPPADDEDDITTNPPEDDEDDTTTNPPEDDEDDTTTNPPEDDEDDTTTNPPEDDEDDTTTNPPEDDEDDTTTNPPEDDEDDTTTNPPEDDEDDTTTNPPEDDEDDTTTNPPEDDEDDTTTTPPSEDENGPFIAEINVEKIENLSDDFIMGVDISSLLSLEASGRVFYGYDGKCQDIFAILAESGVNYIRVRVWNNPYDENGNGYGGGNCTVDTAIALGKRAAEYGMGLLVDFHYSDFWADPAKQKAPKAWANMTLAQKTDAIYSFTYESITKIKNSGVKIGMVQIGNETTGGMAGESYSNMFTLMNSAAKAIRNIDSSILIAVHFTNPEKGRFSNYANDLKNNGVDYDVFATSYYPEYHGTIANLKTQLSNVMRISGKKVMVAETSWAHTSSNVGTYEHSVQGQADEIFAVIKAMAELGSNALGVFYWEPAWIDVPGTNENTKHQLRETYGAGWASSYAGSYDPDDAGMYYGATACIPTALFDSNGYALESLKTFLYVRKGATTDPSGSSGGEERLDNYIKNPSFEESDYSMWNITEKASGTVDFQNKSADAKDGSMTLHFWSSSAVEFTATQTVTALPNGSYKFSLDVQGDGEGSNAILKIFVISDGVRYEQTFTLDGWCVWQTPTIDGIVCNSGSMTVGIEVKAASGAWGTVDCVSLSAN